MTRLLWILRLALAALFLWAGIAKALRPAAFAQDVLAYQLLPQFAAAALALYLPWLEITAAIALLLPAFRRAASLTLLTLLLIFSTAMLIAFARGLHISCGCFSTGFDNPTLPTALLRNALLLALLALTLWPSHQIKVPQTTAR